MTPSQRPPQREKNTAGVSETIVVAALPVAGYLVALAYALGFSSYFGFPLELLSIGVTDVFVAGLAVFGLGAMLWNFARNVYLFRPDPEVRRLKQRQLFRSAIGRRLAVLMTFPLLYLPFPALFGFGATESILAGLAVGGAMTLYALFVFFLPWVTERDTPYREKIVRAEGREAEQDPSLDVLALRALEKRIGLSATVALVLIVLSALYGYFAGRAAAKGEE